MKRVDITKKYQTRDGRPVTLISDKGRDSYPVIGYIGDSRELEFWAFDGYYNTDGLECRSDILPVPEIIERLLILSHDGYVWEDECPDTFTPVASERVTFTVGKFAK